jgi:chaperonin GroEL
MAYKQVLFRSEAREKILRGVTALADAVRVTLGPKSKCVLLEKRFGVPVVCNDGVTIAKEMALKDPVENLRLLLGSVASRVIGLARCPVLLVRSRTR